MRDELLTNPLGSGVLSADTSAAAEQLQISRWREMAPSEKLKIVADVCSSTRELALAGIRQRHPAASDAECHLRFAQLTLGPTLADAAYPEAKSLRPSRRRGCDDRMPRRFRPSPRGASGGELVGLALKEG